MLQLFIPFFDLAEHFVKAIQQNPDLVVTFIFNPQGVIFRCRNGLHHSGKPQNRYRNYLLQFSGYEEGHQRSAGHDCQDHDNIPEQLDCQYLCIKQNDDGSNLAPLIHDWTGHLNITVKTPEGIR